MKPLPSSGIAAGPPTLALRLPAGLVRASGDGVCGLLLLAALVIVWRRAAGALDQPADPPMLLSAGVLAAALAAAFRLAPGAGARPRWMAALPTIALAALGVALSLPGTGAAGLGLLWAPLVAEELGTAWRAWDRRGRRADARPARCTAELLDSAFGLIAAANLAEPPGKDDVTQRLVRSRAADGSETLAGWLRLAFAPGQRQATAHLAFCPPFAQAPLLDLRQADGPPARVRTAQVLAYGARLEVKLSAPAAGPLAVRLEFSAQAAPAEAKLW